MNDSIIGYGLFIEVRIAYDRYKEGNSVAFLVLFGWYRYDTRLALPIYSDEGELQRYNIYKLRMLVRHAEDGKLYLYDFLRTKKKRVARLSKYFTVEKPISYYDNIYILKKCQYRE